MQEINMVDYECTYPGCGLPLTDITQCAKCHHSYCNQHIKRRGWKNICEFCLLRQAALKDSERAARHLVMYLGTLIVAGGILLLLLHQLVIGVAILFTGLFIIASGAARRPDSVPRRDTIDRIRFD
ncbi:MAG: hypothetical protein H0W02_01765 [Ktedonobacteraceae bacterium]|nr:hypothetical protein [Ktedonobacteraceae bacterium]